MFVNIRTIFKMFRRKQTGDFSWRADGMVNVFEIKLIDPQDETKLGDS